MTTEIMLEDNECAVVTVQNGTVIEFYTPDDTELTTTQQYIIACAVRYYDDPIFVEETIKWLNDKAANTDN